MECYFIEDETDIEKISNIPENKFNKRIDALLPEEENSTAQRIKLCVKISEDNEEDNFGPGDTIYTVSKVEFGQTAGYRLTDLVYAGDLISNIGESITSILDKIV
jgi:hypothetical protein